MLNDKVLLFFEGHSVPLLHILTDRGIKYCGRREDHEYQLYLTLKDVYHSKTKAGSPQSNDVCEQFHKTVLNEFYRITFRKKIYNMLDELQVNLDTWIKSNNEERTHSGKNVLEKHRCKRF